MITDLNGWEILLIIIAVIIAFGLIAYAAILIKRWLIRRYKQFISNFIQRTIELENRIKIRNDIIRWYQNSLSSRNAIALAYSTKPKNWYYIKIIENGNTAKEYNAFKLYLKRSEKTKDDLESITDWATIFDIITKLALFLIPPLTLIFSKDLGNYLSFFLLAISSVVLVLNWIIEIIKMDSEEIQKLIENLTIKESDICLPNGNLLPKDQLYGPFIWNKSLCNPSTISIFLIMLYLKKLFPITFDRMLKKSMQVSHSYMKTVKKPVSSLSRIELAIFSLKKWVGRDKQK
jgi:hypothetical protein